MAPFSTARVPMLELWLSNLTAVKPCCSLSSSCTSSTPTWKEAMSTYMTTEQLAEYLTVPVNTIYQWRHRGTAPRAARLGRHLRWKQADVDRWIEQRTNDTTD